MISLPSSSNKHPAGQARPVDILPQVAAREAVQATDRRSKTFERDKSRAGQRKTPRQTDDEIAVVREETSRIQKSTSYDQQPQGVDIIDDVGLPATPSSTWNSSSMVGAVVSHAAMICQSGSKNDQEPGKKASENKTNPSRTKSLLGSFCFRAAATPNACSPRPTQGRPALALVENENKAKEEHRKNSEARRTTHSSEQAEKMETAMWVETRNIPDVEAERILNAEQRSAALNKFLTTDTANKDGNNADKHNLKPSTLLDPAATPGTKTKTTMILRIKMLWILFLSLFFLYLFVKSYVLFLPTTVLNGTGQKSGNGPSGVLTSSGNLAFPSIATIIPSMLQFLVEKPKVYYRKRELGEEGDHPRYNEDVNGDHDHLIESKARILKAGDSNAAAQQHAQNGAVSSGATSTANEQSADMCPCPAATYHWHMLRKRTAQSYEWHGTGRVPLFYANLDRSRGRKIRMDYVLGGGTTSASLNSQQQNGVLTASTSGTSSGAGAGVEAATSPVAEKTTAANQIEQIPSYGAAPVMRVPGLDQRNLENWVQHNLFTPDDILCTSIVLVVYCYHAYTNIPF